MLSRVISCGSCTHSSLRSKNFRLKKLYSTRSTISVNVTDTGDHVVVLPLSNSETCAFPLYRDITVRDLVHDIRSEDPNITEIQFNDADGVRLSHSISVKDLLATDFQLKLNGNVYDITVPALENNRNGPVGGTELNDLVKKVYIMKIKEKLKSETRQHIKHEEFMKWCRSYGLSETESETLLSALHDVGTVLHFKNNRQLADTIFLKPHILTDQLSESLKLRIVKRSDAELQSQLDALLPEYKALSLKKIRYDRASQRRANIILYTGLAYLTFQFGLLFRFVYWEFSWNVVEPISYFVSLAVIISGLTFFMNTDTEFTYEGLREHLINRRLKTLYLKRKFDWKRWKELDDKIKSLQKALDIRPFNN